MKISGFGVGPERGIQAWFWGTEWGEANPISREGRFEDLYREGWGGESWRCRGSGGGGIQAGFGGAGGGRQDPMDCSG